jgi:hypothetical protein
MSSNVKYIGLDVHKEAISIAVLNDDAGKLVMESIIVALGKARRRGIDEELVKPLVPA